MNLDLIIEASTLLVRAGKLEMAAHLLNEAGFEWPNNPQIEPYTKRVEFLIARSNDPTVHEATEAMLEDIASMRREVDAHPLYGPGKFWASHCDFHVDLLRVYGIESFKRTVSHNYQNWLMTSYGDPQVLRLLEIFSNHSWAEPLSNEIERPSHVGFPQSMSLSRPEYALANPENLQVYGLAVGILWEHVLSNDTFSVLKDLDELEVGDPIRIRRHGHLISSDLAHSVRERNLLLEAFRLTGGEGLTVGELGAGHGRLAEVFGRTTNYRYIIFDIPPALYVAQWYIEKIFPREKIFRYRHFNSYSEIADELSEARFAFFTSNQIQLLPDGATDLFCNMNSLMEMRPEQIQNFLGHIQRLTRTGFLSRQWIRWHNRQDEVTVCKEDFSLGEGWRNVLDETDDIHPQFFNNIWKRELKAIHH